ncbi:MAG: alginate export family protein [Chlamydiota bacterium]|nr:alginate export family protein [Chlamydiota bacterium]
MKKILFGIIAMFVLVGTSYAEVQNVKVSGELRLRGLYTSSQDLGISGEDYGRFEERALITVEADLTDHVLAVVEIGAKGFQGAKEHTDAASIEGYDAFVVQAYVQASEVFYSPLTLKLGRQYMNYGTGFLISDKEKEINFDVARSIWDFYPIIVDVVWGKLADRSVEQAVDPITGDGAGSDDSQLWLINAHYAADVWNAEAYILGLTDSGSGYEPITLGLRGDVAPMDALDVWGEFAYQLNSYSATQDLSAWALNAGGSFSIDAAWKPVLELEAVVASGDSGSGDYEGFQELYEYNYWGYAFSPKIENLVLINANISVMPTESLTLALDYYHYWQMEESVFSHGDLYQDNGGVLASTNGTDKSLGDEIDVIATYDYTEDVSTQLYLAWFLPGAAYSDDDTQFEIRGEILVSF